MPSIYVKRGKLWARLKGDRAPGKWSDVPTGYAVGQEDKAREFAEEAQLAIDQRNGKPGKLTLRAWVKPWLERRREAGHDWKHERGRLRKWVLPVIGDKELSAITAADLAGIVHHIRFVAKKANRTARNVYGVVNSAFRDARIAGLVKDAPCILTDAQLGPLVDADPEWRDGAVFTRDEAEVLISDERIPFDRRLVYAFGLLAGLRPGEAAALRWRHYDAACEPLGKLLVAHSYSTRTSSQKRTKTQTTKAIPVHPTLAAMLAAWKLSGWASMMSAEPGANDLIVPLPPTVKRTRRTGDRFRGYDYTGRRWRDEDLPLLGWRSRSVYDTKSTFITLAIEDGANPTVIRERVTHTRPRRNAFDGYDRGPHWIETCREVGRLQIRRLAATMLPQRTNHAQSLGNPSSGGGYRTHDFSMLASSRFHTFNDFAIADDVQRAWLAATHATASEG